MHTHSTINKAIRDSVLWGVDDVVWNSLLDSLYTSTMAFIWPTDMDTIWPTTRQSVLSEIYAYEFDNQ